MKGRVGLKWLFGFIFLVIVAVSIFVFYPKQEEPIPVSLVRLIANPDDFDGKVVRTQGLLLASGNRYVGRLYLSREDAIHRNQFNSILILPDELPEEYGPFKTFHRDVVIIDGLFHHGRPYSQMDHLEKIFIVNPIDLEECYFYYTEEKCGPTIVDPLEEKQHNGAQ